jgi:hypothetical protein
MALTIEQDIALFQVLEVPWQPEVNQLVDKWNLVVQKWSVTDSIRQANRAIRDYLAAYITPVAAAEARLKEYLDRWILIGTDTVVLSGGVGPVQGVTSDPNQERLEIQRQVKGFLPFYRAHEEASRLEGSSGTYVAIIR